MCFIRCPPRRLYPDVTAVTQTKWSISISKNDSISKSPVVWYMGEKGNFRQSNNGDKVPFKGRELYREAGSV